MMYDDRLRGLHSDLVAVVYRAFELCEIEFAVIEGLRTIEKQRILFAKGASKTMNSRHLDGHAVDLAPVIDGEIRWDWPPFYKIATAVKAAAEELGTPIEWGGDWTRGFKDGPHWQLPWADYPKVAQ